ncbi:MAG: hypothetical protein ABUS79_05715, partial [Pseudomonadota bacterium]
DPNGPMEVSLSALLPAGAQPVGVAVSPEGQRYVLDRLSGLYELGPDGAKLVWKTSELASRYGQRADLDLTDIVALGSEQFAITAENDGFRLDLHGGTFSSYFCYLPSLPAEPVVVPLSISQTLQLQGIEVRQRTESVAFSPGGQLLFAQPQTFRMDTGAVAGSELFIFRATGGEPIQIRTIPETTFVATGMVAVGEDRLLLGNGHSLYEVTATTGPFLVKDLAEAIQIAGLARQPNGDLLVLDRAGNRLLRVPSP